MSDMNSVNLIGRVGADPEVRFTTGGTAVGNVRLAVSRKFKDREGQRQEATVWVRCVAWDKRAEVLRDYVHKGDRLGVSGYLEEREWTDKEGVKRRVMEVRVHELTLLGSRREAGDEQPQRNMRPDPPTGRQGPSNPPPGEEDFDDDIPFE
jgi:single-strand DNA-binding protein